MDAVRMASLSQASSAAMDAVREADAPPAADDSPAVSASAAAAAASSAATPAAAATKIRSRMTMLPAAPVSGGGARAGGVDWFAPRGAELAEIDEEMKALRLLVSGQTERRPPPPGGPPRMAAGARGGAARAAAQSATAHPPNDALLGLVETCVGAKRAEVERSQLDALAEAAAAARRAAVKRKDAPGAG